MTPFPTTIQTGLKPHPAHDAVPTLAVPYTCDVCDGVEPLRPGEEGVMLARDERFIEGYEHPAHPQYSVPGNRHRIRCTGRHPSDQMLAAWNLIEWESRKGPLPPDIAFALTAGVLFAARQLP